MDFPDDQLPMAPRQQVDHLFNLHNLFRRTAKKTEQGFTKRLLKNSQSGERVQAAREVGIASPRQRVLMARMCAVDCEIMRQCERNVFLQADGRAPDKLVFVKGQSRDVTAPYSVPGAIRLSVPTKGLPSVD